MNSKLYYYQATVIKVIDGDTFDVDVDMGFHIHNHIRIRVLDVDTPELKITKGVDEKEKGQLAKQFAEKVVMRGPIYIHTVSQDSFGRWLAEVRLESNMELSNLYNLAGINKLCNTYNFDDFNWVKNYLAD